MIKGRLPEEGHWSKILLISIFFVVVGFIIFNVDFSKLIFGEINNPEIEKREVKAISEGQLEEILNLYKQTQNEPENKREEATYTPQNAIYRYEREDGVIVMVNDINKVPTQYRSKMKVLGGEKADQTTTPIRVINDNRMIVNTTINYNGRSESINLLIDTGATGISLSRNSAHRLGINPGEGRQGTATFADGRKSPTTFIKVDSIKVGPKTLLNPDIHIIYGNREEDEGLLGMEFLKEFPHTFDLKNQKIKWL